MRNYTLRGDSDWSHLIGKTISFTWSDGWEDYDVHYVFGGVQDIEDESGYILYYLMDQSGGGYGVWGHRELEVQVYEAENDKDE